MTPVLLSAGRVLLMVDSDSATVGAQVSSWEADATAFQPVISPAAETSSAAGAAARPTGASRIQLLRSKVYAMSAMKAFSGFVQSINKVTESTALANDDAQDPANVSQPEGQLTGEAMLRRASDLLLEQRSKDEVSVGLCFGSTTPANVPDPFFAAGLVGH